MPFTEIVEYRISHNPLRHRIRKPQNSRLILIVTGLTPTREFPNWDAKFPYYPDEILTEAHTFSGTMVQYKVVVSMNSREDRNTRRNLT